MQNEIEDLIGTNRMINHSGIITKISTDKVTVSIAPDASECSGCAINTLCRKNEEIEVPFPHPTHNLIGTSVTIGINEKIQRKGMLLFFAIPIILLIGLIICAYCIGLSDSVSAIISIGSVVIWYLILYIMRVRIRNQAEFKIIQ